MKVRGIRQARADFFALVRDVEEGGQVILTRRGRPAAILISSDEYQSLLDREHEVHGPDASESVQQAQ